jgi:ribonuclease BN (tRNA processing enzyme)
VGLTVTVLGRDGSFAGPGGACTGYLLRGAGTTVWLDAGPGTLANLQQHVALSDLDAIVVSHSHPDHWLELPVVRNALKYILEVEGVSVYGTAETAQMLRALSGTIEPTFKWTTIDATSVVRVGGMTLRFSLTDHPVETLAVHVEADGRRFAFSSDTGPGWSAASFDQPIDLLLCEASLSIENEGRAPHVSGRQAGAMARAAGVARLVVTHIVPGADAEQHRLDAEATFGGPVDVATIHASYEI